MKYLLKSSFPFPRRNCGFLTEAEEARWEIEARWEGSTVKSVGNAGEYWAGKAR